MCRVNAFLLVAALSVPVRAKPAGLSLEEKVGQLFMIAIDTETAARYEPYIKEGKLGGALLRWDRFTGEEAREFTQKLQGWAAGSPGRVPILFAADHEGGASFTQRTHGATVFPGNMALGAAGEPSLARRAARVSGRELQALGIRVNFAPVVDVNTNPDNPIIGARSFGEVPETVARFGTAAVRGYLESGIAPVAKHFPGHGDTGMDSHYNLPVIGRSLPDLERADLVPFRAAIRAGVPMVMPAHILVPALDPAAPVPLSSAAIEGLLRGRMRFKGVVVSDSLDMGAIVNNMGIEEAAVRAIEAGCDVLLIGKYPLPDAYLGVLAAVLKGRISRERLDRSVSRVLRLKARLGMLGAGTRALPPMSEVGSPANRALAFRIASRAVTLLGNGDRLLPLRLQQTQGILLVSAWPPRPAQEIRTFHAELAKRHARTDLVELSHMPDAAAIDAAVEKARAADLVIFGSYHSGFPDFSGQTELWRRLEALGRPLVAASLMNPYDLRYYPGVRTAVAAYGPTPVALEALARALFGEIQPRGRLPVTIPGAFPRGAGLTGFKKREIPRR